MPSRDLSKFAIRKWDVTQPVLMAQTFTALSILANDGQTRQTLHLTPQFYFDIDIKF